jgi:UDP-N-acetylmuramate dehydrogenase
MNVQENIPLAPLTTLAVGGTARFFVRAESIEEVKSAVNFATNKKLPLFVLGGGSNVLISDRGWPGLALQVGILGISETQNHEEVEFTAGAGEDWDDFIAHCVARNCSGLECLSGIPGTVGGTPVQNVGAYGQEVSQTITSVLAFDPQEGCVRELSAADCGFAYRTSIFNTTERDRYIILQVTYALRPGGAPNLRYADLQKYFAGQPINPTLAQTREAVRTIRASKGMLIAPGDPDSRSVGSFFKNPVLTEAQHQDLIRRAEQCNLKVPSYPALAQQHKVSAAWLVEHSGFAKGYANGNVGISSKHALAIINRGGASASEIIALKDEIQRRVQATWGVRLEAEPVLVGF